MTDNIYDKQIQTRFNLFYLDLKRYPIRNFSNDNEDELASWRLQVIKKYKSLSYDEKEKIEFKSKFSLDNWVWIKSFIDKYNELLFFIKINNRLPTTKKCGLEQSLYYWCKRQKHAYKKNSLKEEHINLLNKISIWTWDILSFYKKKHDENHSDSESINESSESTTKLNSKDNNSNKKQKINKKKILNMPRIIY